MKTSLTLGFVVLFTILLTPPLSAQEEVYLKVTSPGLQRVVIALRPFGSSPGTDVGAAASFLGTLRLDLDQTAVVGLLQEENARLVEIDPKNQTLNNQRWRSVGAQFLLEGTLAGSTNQLVAEVHLIDLVSGEVAFSRRFQSANNLAATMAHTLANELIRLFTGKPGPFLSRIAFVSDRSGNKELWVMRWDGSDPQQLTSHRTIAVGPTWSPDGQLLAFTSFLHGNPQLYILRPTQGIFKPLTSQPGVNSSPSFSPDGKRIVFASGNGGDTHIFVISADGGIAERLTTTRGICTQPAWSPNGRQIAFTSTASGSPQLYLMDIEGSNVRRLTTEDKFADEATWAPDGVRVAYTTLVDDRFQIAILDLRTNARTIVSGPGSNESPCFSPDGTILAFVSTRTGKKQIFLTDQEGRPRQITMEGNNAGPTWVSQIQ